MLDTHYPILDSLKGQLIVSCQAEPHEPLYGEQFMAAMARAAQIGGAAAIRANGPDDIAAIRKAVDLPVMGIHKQKVPGSEVYITPDFAAAQRVVRAGAAIIALDGTPRPRPGGETLSALIARIHDELQTPVMADISCLEDALGAQAAGADWIGTTLAGYTAHGRPALPGPDLDLITMLVAQLDQPVIAEGRFTEPAQVAQAFQRGAFAVVVGGAITRPHDITRRFVSAASAPPG